ncbi:MAG: formyl transferase [Candidatus Marinimicrobia bacterium]|nr:formyl transferase [Candidatus Neomarinimicrobiota bacterium]|tara:strand:+ start:80519 stop:81400 length:882 start_codon:yes stop_codon:yes gene_type:complete
MKIVFIGSVKFSERCLKKIIEIDVKPAGVCTLEESLINTDHADLTQLCNENNIPVKYTHDINSKISINWIRSHNPDVIFCFGWSRLLKPELLKIAPHGVVGYHPTELPENRGRHPLIWSLVLGFAETASTFFFMDEGADSGDILSQKRIEILENDDAGDLYRKMTETALGQLEEFVPALVSGRYERTPQDHSKANTWRKRGKKDGVIDWRMTARSINNLVRGLTKPYIGAHFELDDKIIKVWKTKIIRNQKKNIEPGKVLVGGTGEIIIKTGEDSILLKETEPIISLKRGTYL